MIKTHNITGFSNNNLLFQSNIGAIIIIIRAIINYQNNVRSKIIFNNDTKISVSAAVHCKIVITVKLCLKINRLLRIVFKLLSLQA